MKKATIRHQSTCSRESHRIGIYLGMALLLSRVVAGRAEESATAIGGIHGVGPNAGAQKTEIPVDFFHDFMARGLVSPNQSAKDQADADRAWMNIFAPIDGYPCDFKVPDEGWDQVPLGYELVVKKEGVGTAAFWKYYARWLQQYRDRGLVFWDRFPDDRRRWVWLFNTSASKPFYWRDIGEAAETLASEKAYAPDGSKDVSKIELDHDGEASWAIRDVELRAEFLTSTATPRWARVLLEGDGVSDRCADERAGYSVASMPLADPRMRLSQLAMDMWDLYYQNPDLSGFLPNNVILAVSAVPELRRSFIAAMKISPASSLRKFAYAQDIDPVKLELGRPLVGFEELNTLGGTTIGLAELRGSVTLIDFWALWCHPCIEEMPSIKRLFDQYKDQGLKVVGVCFCYDDPNDRNAMVRKDHEISALMTKMDVSWAQCPRGALGVDPLSQKYNFGGLPHLFLVDRQGILMAIDLHDPVKLEAKIKQLLNGPGQPVDGKQTPGI